jgi:2-phosphoglycerate kinase
MSDITLIANKLMEFGYTDTQAYKLAIEIQANLDGHTEELTKIGEIRKVVSRVRTRN